MSVNPAKPTPLEDRFILTSEKAAEFLVASWEVVYEFQVAERAVVT